MANLGDTDGDGEEELAVAAPAAWTERGRTGAVLILGASSGRLIHTIEGPAHGVHFGWNVRAMPPTAISPRTLLAIEDGWESRIVDPRDWRPLRKEPAQHELLLQLDYDGDGYLDVLREPQGNELELVLVSGTTGRELRRLPVGNGRGERRWEPTTLAADFDGDGRKDLALVWPDFCSNTSSLTLYFGAGLATRRTIALDVDKSPDSVMDRWWRALFSCGDLNGDGCDDVLAADPDWSRPTLTCYSGKDGAILWTNATAIVEETASIDRVADLDGDGVGEVASGRVLYLADGVQYGNDGAVVFLSGRTGLTLKAFHERDYPTIGLEHFLATYGK